MEYIHFSEFMTNLAKFLHKYYKYGRWSSNDIIDKTEKLITKYGYGADDCRNLDENTWSAALPMRFVNMKEMGCFTNDLAFINNKIFLVGIEMILKIVIWKKHWRNFTERFQIYQDLLSCLYNGLV